ncbi:alpha/beta fold hydrolase [Paracoccus sediminis]|uniref:Alpha/beta fold hydrolase n=1 Tax=Paracoccus sediminis TaxID=1214787 RepID=A0A238YE56_9RHOB|nr:alpha/beta hydrolase [Paracoccus sediminis]TBN46799.1 alpha/beta fold hydrolase [Paracoccus sediminis]SNR69031.1 Pimeloyl-ACP methyl ester carboxylesterase [Paracoccus sediminis]
MLALVLIPGMMCDARMWGAIPDALDPRPIHHALPVGADSMAGIADAILAAAPPHFALAGLSMGGIVAMEMLARQPGRIDRLALLDTNPRAELPEVQTRRAPQIARARAQGLERVMRDELIPHYLAQDSDALADLCVDMALSLGPDVFERQSLALRDRADRQAALAGFDGPALVLTGADDRLCPMDWHDLMHALMPQSRLVVIDGAGHLPPLERPVETLAALRRWLEDA